MTLADARTLPVVRIDDASLESLTRELAEHAPAHDRDASFPWEGIRAVHAAGILTAPVAAPLSAADASRVFQALGAGDPAVALISAMTVLQHEHQRADPTWPEAARDALLAASLDGPALVNAVRAEPELGAPARGGVPLTTAERTATGWRVTGRKAFATGSEGLALHVVWVVTDEPSPRVGSILVPGDAAGVSIVRTWDHLGLRASSTHDVVYDGVEVPEESFLPERAPQNVPVAGIAPVVVPSIYLGVARAALADFARFARDRVPTSLGRPIATLERIQAVTGEAAAQIAQADAVIARAALAIDAGKPVPDLGLVKTLASRASIAAVEGLVAAIGNPGLTRGQPLERHLRDVLCSRPHPPQDDAAILAAGRALLTP